MSQKHLFEQIKQPVNLP